MSQEQYESVLCTLDTLLNMGKIDETEHAERVGVIERLYAKSIQEVNKLVGRRQYVEAGLDLCHD